MQKNIWIIQTYVPYYQKHSENKIYYQNKKHNRAFKYAAPARILMATEGSHVLHKTLPLPTLSLYKLFPCILPFKIRLKYSLKTSLHAIQIS